MAEIVELETFKVRVHLDLLTRLCAQTFVQGACAAGLTSDECAQVLERRLEEDQTMADEVIGHVVAEPAMTALYSEEVRELFDDVKKEFQKAIESIEGWRT